METKAYLFRGMYVPEDIIESIDRYVEHGVPTGGFLEAVICNDLREACGRADQDNLRIIPAIVGYLYNHCPSTCWGRAYSFDNWITEKRAQRQVSHDAHLGGIEA